LLVIEILPFEAVVDVGENVAVKDVVCPGVRLAGAVQPVSVNPVPVMLWAVIATAAVPVFVIVTGTDPLAPTVTFPNGMLDGLADSTPCVPVPLSGMLIVGLVADEVIAMLPAAAPAVVGANVAVKFAVAPAAIVCPAARLLEPKPGPVVTI
jgi:hypothetical protein